MKLGIHFMNFTLDTPAEQVAPVLADTARVAEGIGAEWFTMMDHYFQMEQYRTAHDPMLEGYTSLGFLAGVTERMRLSLMVTGVTYRYPGLLAKIVTTLDVLSQGRAMLGIGAAWYEREHLALGVPYPPIGQRFEMLEETLQICLQMWSDDEGPYTGKHYSLAETINVPQSVQRPHPPILIGGGGEKKTLRLVAQYADACNLFAAAPEDVARKLDVLRRHCDDLGRDYDAITKSVMGPGDPTTDPDGFLRTMEAYAALGVEVVEVAPQGGDPVSWVAALEPLVPRLAAL
ncbi:LLM class F420-dependent oxidoreductase [Humibacter sp. BT305]|nr:LLM class F420-dependent oxidoreductase [Humibacter sp. BT305]